MDTGPRANDRKPDHQELEQLKADIKAITRAEEREHKERQRLKKQSCILDFDERRG